MELALMLFNHHLLKENHDPSYLGYSKTAGGLPPANSSEPGFVLHDAVGDAHLTAQCGEEHNQLK